jgi:hypothetical protein
MADDNPDDWAPWARAVWLMHARHGIVHNEKLGEDGIKGNPAEIPLHAVRGMIVDLMHFVHERNKVFDEDHYIAFDDIVDDAHEQFIREREAIPDKDPEHMQIGIHSPAGRPDPGLDGLRQELAKRHLAELEALNRKQAAEIQLLGPSKDQDQRHHREFRELVLDLADQSEHAIHRFREAALNRSQSKTQSAAAEATSEEDPRLTRLLTDLQIRQGREAQDLQKRQEQVPYDPIRQEHEREALARKFEQEKERYIRQYKKGRELSEQMQGAEKEKGLGVDHSLDE